VTAPIGIAGAGAFGTALACAWAGSESEAGRDVILWGRDPVTMATADRTRRLPRLPGIRLPDGIRLTADPADLAKAEPLILAVPMQTLAAALPGLPRPRVAIAACKGIELTTLRGPTAILAEAWPGAAAGLLSGPSFAADIARGLPTALSLALRSDDAATIQALLATPRLRLYRTDDLTGVELGGALKNVTAIACGAAIGAGLGDSARAALMTRGMAETLRLAAALGARRETLMGLSGLGDLALTCASPASRNFALGHALGRGDPPPDATTEGVATARAALDLAGRHDIDLPVAAATAGLVSGTLTVEDAIDALLTRDLREE
jgi:glycerol-3-phosphate dehydrogenase (NAD(P)+)